MQGSVKNLNIWPVCRQNYTRCGHSHCEMRTENLTKLSSGTIFSDLERPVIETSRSRRYRWAACSVCRRWDTTILLVVQSTPPTFIVRQWQLVVPCTSPVHSRWPLSVMSHSSRLRHVHSSNKTRQRCFLGWLGHVITVHAVRRGRHRTSRPLNRRRRPSLTHCVYVFSLKWSSQSSTYLFVWNERCH